MNKRFFLAAMAAVTVASLCIERVHAHGSFDDAEVIIEWNQILQTHIPSNAGILTPRYYAMMHIAMFDAANSIDEEYTAYHARVPSPRGASAEAAAAKAAHDILAELISGDLARATFDAALNARLASIPPWRAAQGVFVGRKVAQDILAWRANDGSAAPAPSFVLPLLPGLWQPTPPSFRPAQFPQFGNVVPFALLTSTQYLPSAPPTLTSDAYAADFDEVKRLGSATSTERTPEQTLLARLFAPQGYRTQHWAVWNNLARDMAQRKHWSLVDTARLFALMNASIHDGLQTSHSSKFVYGLWRPITAIQRADDDLNGSTIADPTWTPLITTPPYPSHSSNQTCVGVSASRALARAFGTDEMPFSVTWVGVAPSADVSRAYTRFSQLAADQARSRVYAGIHFTFELTASDASCTKVADYVFDHYMRRCDHHSFHCD
jgi:hypothetical protein